MTIELHIPAELEDSLRQAAQSAGKDVEHFVREVLEKELSSVKAAEAPGTDSGRALALWRRWTASHSLRPGVQMDDSRESVYAGRGE